MVDHNYESDVSVHGFPIDKGESVLAIAQFEDKHALVRLNSHNGQAFPVAAPAGVFGWLIDVFKCGIAWSGLHTYQDMQSEWLDYASTVDDWKAQKNRIDLWQHIDTFPARQIGAK